MLRNSALVAAALALPTITEAARDCTYDISYWGGCKACPASVYTKCKSGFKAYDAAKECGFLSLGCKALCKPKKTPYDYGCGCDQGQACLHEDCVMGDWGPWSSCSVECNPSQPIKYGTMTRNRSIVTDVLGDGKKCDHTGEEVACNSHNCQADCEVSAWGSWSTCSKSCGTGSQTRSRSVTQDANMGGTACPALRQSRSCNTHKCHWFSLSGTSRGEWVEVIADGTTQRKKLTSEFTFGVNDDDISIKFTNDGKGRDVIFEWKKHANNLAETHGEITFPKSWSKWNCGKSNENKRCNNVRNGYFNWSGEYFVTFEKNVQGCSNC